MQALSITFPQRIHPDHDEHPIWPAAHRDGWLTLLVDESDQTLARATARAAAFRILGVSWAFDYDGEEPGSPDLYPLGQIGRIEVNSSTVAMLDHQGMLLAVDHLGLTPKGLVGHYVVRHGDREIARFLANIAVDQAGAPVHHQTLLDLAALALITEGV